MPTVAFHIPDSDLELYLWLKSLPTTDRAKVIIKGLKYMQAESTNAMDYLNPMSLSEIRREAQNKEMEEVKEKIDRWFEDVQTESEQREMLQFNRDNQSWINLRLKYIMNDIPEKYRKEAYFYFRAQYPILAKAAGLND